jgi:Bromodomain
MMVEPSDTIVRRQTVVMPLRRTTSRIASARALEWPLMLWRNPPRLQAMPQRVSARHHRLQKEDCLMFVKRALMADLQPFPFVEPVAAASSTVSQTTIIKTPMDLSVTVAQKLENEQYASLEAFKSDLALIWGNAKTFNRPGEPVITTWRRRCGEPVRPRVAETDGVD